MGALKAMDNVFSVGVQDKNLRVFDIIMTTEHGTSYNAFLVRGGTKTVLFEVVKDKFCEEFIGNIEAVCSPSEIDYIVLNHTEPDHTGCLKRILELAPGATVVGSPTALTFVKEIVNAPFPSQAVNDGDTIDIGGMTMQFLYVPMLHWPDTSFTYIPEIKALFSCDCFGCHYADDRVFNDLMEDVDFGHAYKYYFDEIMGPYKHPHMMNALNKIKDLPIEFIGTGHGPALRKNIPYYLELYRQWSQPEPPHEPAVAIVYVSAYGYTAALARAIHEGLTKGGIKKVTLFDLVTDSMDAAKAAVAGADGMLLGSPTLVGDALPPIYEVMVGLNPVIHKGKFAGAFGSYGWSGEAVQNITTRLEQLRMTLPLPGIRVRLNPTADDLAAARKFGEEFAHEMLGVHKA
ncbi:MAG: FprA family A-type flavoprotein [Ruminococcaceae bacterium]|nr:FprA family A-type flavoprotein [Oscillospiraceae bacterium]